MTLPPLTDFVALLGLDLVLTAALVRLVFWRVTSAQSRSAVLVFALIFFLLMWWPVAAAPLPLLAYVRGVSSDLSVSFVLVAVLGLGHRTGWWQGPGPRERHALAVALALAALVLYPTALGWGDADVYRAGWGGLPLGLALLFVCAIAWWRGFRLLPMAVAAALIAWSFGLMESTNLWDYLIDPWLAIASIFQCLRCLWCWLVVKVRSSPAERPVS